MIPFREALALVLNHAPRMGTEACRLENACGRVLRQEIRADRAFPPFDRVMMDGYALRSKDLLGGGAFRVTGQAPAGGEMVVMPEAPASCLEVMTGTPLPSGADCIIPVEETTRPGPDEIIIAKGFEHMAGRFIHPVGSDAAEGEILLQSGVLLESRQIGVAASCGVAMVEVSKLPRITIIPTGDELVAMNISPAAHQIRQSNGHALRSALQRAGIPSVLANTLSDDASADDLHVHLESFEWLIITGAISKGSRDFVPALLDSLGCKRLFHGVAQRPGKPAGCWLGQRQQIIIALPGNPVSAITGLHAFVLPAIAVASGMPLPKQRLVNPAECFDGLPGITHHLPVTLGDDGRARPAPTGNSGDFIGLLKSDGFVTLPPRGEWYSALPFVPWL